ncbi:hypothetical protein [Anabaena sp. 4-3]|uniref:hypothetical protein n=1 Tax=Anabaena sp. 4-3 TaxID=1811979 RepID=UPI000830BEF2|nr:hypothetical protein [Anabaena sp. 4-3]
MSNRRYPPANLRYLKARLLNLGRPSFWGTAIFLCVLGLLIQQYWSNPDIFTQQRNQVTESDAIGSELSDEDRAIAADIDNLPLLLDSSQSLNLPVTTNNSQDNNSNNQLASVSKKPQSARTKPSNSVSQSIYTITTPQNNIFVTQAENLLRFGATDNHQLLGLQSFNPASQATNNPVNAAGVAPELQTLSNISQNSSSINPSATVFSQPTSSLNYTSSSVTNSISNSAVGGVLQTAPLNISPMQSFSPSTVINSRPADIPQNTPNLSPNYYTNYNHLQTVPSQVQVTSPVITRTSPIIGPYTVRNSRNGVVTPTTQVVPNNYNNSIWQQPHQYP